MSDRHEELVPEGYVRSLFDITNRIAVVTGAASGLGKAIALGFAQAGAEVVVADVDEKGGEDTVDAIKRQGGRAMFRRVNVTDAEDVDAFSSEIVGLVGQIDTLVNSAGSAFRAPAESFPADQLDAILDLNLKGTFYCCQAIGRHMLEQGSGTIINLASIGSFIAYPWAAAYLASKGGVSQMTKAFALEWRERGVRVNAIGPTLMDSPLTQRGSMTASNTSEFIRARMLRDRLGLPRELIGAALFLASDASELVTGHILMCDDGYLIA